MKYTKRKKKLKGTREKREKRKISRMNDTKEMMKNKGGGRKETYHWLEEYYQT